MSASIICCSKADSDSVLLNGLLRVYLGTVWREAWHQENLENGT